MVKIRVIWGHKEGRKEAQPVGIWGDFTEEGKLGLVDSLGGGEMECQAKRRHSIISEACMVWYVCVVRVGVWMITWH